MKKTYIIPKSDLIKIECEKIIASSNNYECDNNCKIWHICLDRQLNKTCLDKRKRY